MAGYAEVGDQHSSIITCRSTYVSQHSLDGMPDVGVYDGIVDAGEGPLLEPRGVSHTWGVALLNALHGHKVLNEVAGRQGLNETCVSDMFFFIPKRVLFAYM